MLDITISTTNVFPMSYNHRCSSLLQR